MFYLALITKIYYDFFFNTVNSRTIKSFKNNYILFYSMEIKNEKPTKTNLRDHLPLFKGRRVFRKLLFLILLLTDRSFGRKYTDTH